MNGLQAQYSENVAFESLNAADNADGQSAFEQLILPGHPSIVIFDADGQEVYRAFGSFEEEILESELIALIE